MKATGIEPSWCKLSLKGAKFKVENDGGPGKKGSLKSVKNPALLFAAKIFDKQLPFFLEHPHKSLHYVFMCCRLRKKLPSSLDRDKL